MNCNSDYEFEQGNAMASITENIEAGACNLVDRSLIMLKDKFPCKVTFFSQCKTGKHGAGKATIIASDIFTDSTYRECFPSTKTVQRPIVTKVEYTCDYVNDDGFLHLITPELEEKEDVKLPEEDHLRDVAKRIVEICNAGTKECLVTIQKWGMREQVCAVREAAI